MPVCCLLFFFFSSSSSSSLSSMSFFFFSSVFHVWTIEFPFTVAASKYTPNRTCCFTYELSALCVSLQFVCIQIHTISYGYDTHNIHADTFANQYEHASLVHSHTAHTNTHTSIELKVHGLIRNWRHEFDVSKFTTSVKTQYFSMWERARVCMCWCESIIGWFCCDCDMWISLHDFWQLVHVSTDTHVFVYAHMQANTSYKHKRTHTFTILFTHWNDEIGRQQWP